MPIPTAEGTLAGVAVWVEGTGSAGPPRAEALELRACGLSPAVVVVPPGSALSVRNTGKEACELTLGAPGEDGALARTLVPGATAGLAPAGLGLRRFSCAPRTCTGGVVLAASGGSTGQDGTLTLPAVQVGLHTVHAWHPAWGEGSATVTVAEGATADVTVEVP